jgi:hypothetical protein
MAVIWVVTPPTRIDWLTLNCAALLTGRLVELETVLATVAEGQGAEVGPTFVSVSVGAALTVAVAEAEREEALDAVRVEVAVRVVLPAGMGDWILTWKLMAAVPAPARLFRVKTTWLFTES